MNINAPLNFNQSTERVDREPPADSITLSELFEQLVGIIRRQFPIFVFVIACVTALGLVYLITTPPSFTAHAIMLIDSSKLRVLQQQDTPLGDVAIDTAQVETQVEILKSENIGLSVIKELKLTDEPEFVAGRAGLLSGLLDLFSSPAVQSDTALTRRALGAFLGKRTIGRVGRTYVLDIGFSSMDPPRAANIANAIADAYIVDQLEAKYQATKRASVWLQDRIKELRQQASDADRAVLDYKEKNKIISVGGASSGGGPRLLGEQQLEDLNAQLGSARAGAEEAKARLERINDVIHKDVTDATVADSLKSEVITRLRNNYLDLAAKEAIWSARYGSGHLAAVNLRTQMTELRRSMRDELGRIAESYKSDYEISKSRVEGLERELQKLVKSSQVTNRDRLGLTDLESTAKVYHSIYDNFLQRYMEAIQQQSFPITEARVISAAAPPESKSSPKTFVVLGIAGGIGLILSFGIALIREAIDRVFRSSRQVEINLHTRCLAVLPRLVIPMQPPFSGRPPGDKTGRAKGKGAAHVADPSLGPDAGVLAKVSQKTQLDLSRAFGKDRIIERSIAKSRPFMRYVVDDPLSPFAEGFRSMKVAADINGSRVIGVTSTIPAEGKSTVSSNLAQLMAHAGKRVILVDGDLRNPSLTRAIATHSKIGLLEVLNGQTTLQKAIQIDEASGLSVLPLVTNSRLTHTHEILGSSEFKTFVEGLRSDYDYIIIDFSPIAPIVDVRATTQVVDSYIYVVEWGQTPINLVQHQLARFPELYDRLLGVVLNKADVRVLERYETYHYGNKYYGGQYYSSTAKTE
jgi:succinoglycan biosynthesis transport protein ExoP